MIILKRIINIAFLLFLIATLGMLLLTFGLIPDEHLFNGTTGYALIDIYCVVLALMIFCLLFCLVYGANYCIKEKGVKKVATHFAFTFSITFIIIIVFFMIINKNKAFYIGIGSAFTTAVLPFYEKYYELNFSKKRIKKYQL